MAVGVTEVVGGALGGAVVTSLLGPLIAQRAERRGLRADVLRAIARLERERWAPGEWGSYREAVAAVRATALVAAAPRELVDHYLAVAHVARGASDASWEENPDEEHGGGIPSELADLVRHAGELLVDHLWHPRDGDRCEATTSNV